MHAETYIQKLQKQPNIERKGISDDKHIGVLKTDKFNITTPFDKMNNIKIRRRDQQSKALSELGSIW